VTSNVSLESVVDTSMYKPSAEIVMTVEIDLQEYLLVYNNKKSLLLFSQNPILITSGVPV